jgi:hypothetical protein
MEAIDVKNKVETWREGKLDSSRQASAQISSQHHEIVAETKNLIKIVNDLMMSIP